ncbi:MAG: helix-turn-helix transcriptional regulator [Bacteroides sp.]|nr:helix-turn-helix transcriptional regulator [Bacteroides sp.]
MARYIHIGQAVEARVNELKMSQAEFGTKIGVAQQNIRRIFERESIDTDKLVAISAALKFNFFELYCELQPIKIIGSGNQVNQMGAHHNVNESKLEEDLREQIAQLKSQLADKERIIKLMEERR